MITKLSIKNFKAFDNVIDAKLGHLTLLTGINGRGKSSFLQALLLLSQSMRNSDQHTLENLMINGDWVSLGSFSDIKNIYTPDEANIEFAIETDAETENKFSMTYRVCNIGTIGELCSLKVNGMETFSESSSFSVKISSAKENNILKKDGNLSAPTISSYTSLTDLQRLYYIAADRYSAGSEEQTEGARWLDKRGKNILNIIYSQGEKFQENIECILSRIFEGATFRIMKEGQSLRLYMDSMNDGEKFSPVNVGYGYSYVLSMIVVGLLAKKGEFIVVENPEAHLHPSAQAAMMAFFYKEVIPKGVQILIETHSDHIVNASLIAVRDREIEFSREQLEIIFFFRQKDGNHRFMVQNLDITEKGRVKNPPKGFCDQYAMDLSRLMGF